MPKPPGYWLEMRNQRLFLDKLWREFNLNTFGDWVRVTPRQVIFRIISYIMCTDIDYQNLINISWFHLTFEAFGKRW